MIVKAAYDEAISRRDEVDRKAMEESRVFADAITTFDERNRYLESSWREEVHASGKDPVEDDQVITCGMVTSPTEAIEEKEVMVVVEKGLVEISESRVHIATFMDREASFLKSLHEASLFDNKKDQQIQQEEEKEEEGERTKEEEKSEGKEGKEEQTEDVTKRKEAQDHLNRANHDKAVAPNGEKLVEKEVVIDPNTPVHIQGHVDNLRWEAHMRTSGEERQHLMNQMRMDELLSAGASDTSSFPPIRRNSRFSSPRDLKERPPRVSPDIIRVSPLQDGIDFSVVDTETVAPISTFEERANRANTASSTTPRELFLEIIKQ